MDLRLCFLLFFTLADICAGVGLNYGDPGVCNGTAYDTVTVKVPHKCKNNKRKTCNRIEKQSHPRAVLSCCEGWIYRDTKCVPDVVTCDPPLAPLNRTHCAPVCAPDEYNDPTNPSLMCKPKCTQNCTFGNCTDIDTCSCFDGYEKISQFECKPVCETCENGSCEGPDQCVCNLGYRDLIKGKCKPICDKCEHGTCVRPNECICDPGYTLQGNNCEPICDENCQHGSCTAPNQCTCEANYTLDHTNNFKCNPICEQNCVNGSCVSPNTCACNDGFEMTESSWICRPKCKHCENGQCIGPNQCACDTGYTLKRLYEDSWSKCYPICEVQCANGECIAPNTCKCDLGYEWNLETKVCQPICEGGCVNATCVAPNTCKCLKGYDKRNGSSVCKPVCESCFGECVAPDMCLFSINCKECEGSCKEGVCACSNGTACQELGQEAAGVASTPTLAGIQITWMMGGAVLVLLLVIIAVVIRHIYHKSTYEQKAQGVDMNTYGSVVYTVPNTLTSPGERDYQEEDYDDLENPKENELGLLKPNEYVERL